MGIIAQCLLCKETVYVNSDRFPLPKHRCKPTGILVPTTYATSAEVSCPHCNDGVKPIAQRNAPKEPCGHCNGTGKATLETV